MSWEDSAVAIVKDALAKIGCADVEVRAFPFETERRKELITGSDLAAVCGASEYRDLRAVLAKKLSNLPDVVTQQMALGQVLEAHMAGWWIEEHEMFFRYHESEDHPITLITLGEWRESDMGYGCTYDMVLYNGTSPAYAIDFKTTGSDGFSKWGTPDKSGTPPDAWYQFQMQAHLTNLPFIEAWVMNRSNGDRMSSQVEYVPGEWDEISEAIKLANQYLNSGIIPEPDVVKAKASKVKRDATPEEIEVMAQIEAYKVAQEDLQSLIEDARKWLDEQTKVGETVAFPSGATMMKYSKKTGGTVAWKALAEAKGATKEEILACTSPVGSVDIFQIKPPKENHEQE